MIKNMFRYIMAIILAVSIIGLVVIYLASSTVLKQSYVIKQLEKNNYYSKIREQVISDFENYIYQSGLDENVLESIVTEDRIKEDTNKIISNIFSGINEEVNIEEIESQISNNFKEAVKSTYNRNLTPTEEKAVETLVGKLSNEYATTILHFNVEKQIYDVYAKVIEIIQIAKKVLCISAGASFLLLILLSLRRIYRIFTMSGIALLVSGGFMAVSNYILNSQIKVNTITFYNQGISDVIKSVLSDILLQMKNYGIIMLASGIVIIVIANLVHNIIKAKYMKEAEEEAEKE